MSKIDELRRRYERAMHGMQAGVSLDETHDPKNLTPKHLRVGVNSVLVDSAAALVDSAAALVDSAAALVDSAALAGLLIGKGLITEEEYFQAARNFHALATGSFQAMVP